jgi:hypothetical protein
MCWSGEASAVLACAGFSSAGYLYYRREPKALCYALGYFSAMEALQAFTYSVIDQCSNPANQAATVLGYVHIAFQPFFINAVSLHFTPEPARKRLQPFVYGLCAIATCLFLLRLYPFGWAQPCYEIKYSVPFCPSCEPRVPFCGKTTCSLSGSWHIAWQIPARFNYYLDNSYMLAAFFLPLLYGSWRMTLYHAITGPILAYSTTQDPNEWPAVWCLFSIALLGLAAKSPVRRLLYVRRYPAWLLRKGPGAPEAQPKPEKGATTSGSTAMKKKRGRRRAS